ncbi:alpha/beta hydrolase [Bacteroides sp. CG01]|uniref:alpha/beta hydrolase n=1 Tax=Bacteroides sp. CG01 TaxID=3096000 RepID=UPI002AFF9CF6|nr:alpha/beta hydrolase-fold protein [Bacteroides sp. CG01]
MKYVYIIILLVVIGGLTPFSVQAQDSIHIGTRHTLFSQILNEERAYWVYEPERQAGDSIRNLPVLYLLDGDVFFHSVVGFTRFFSSSKVSSLPPCIVVAVLNTDRTRDFTPTCSAARRDGTIHSGDKPQGGGAEQFYRFLTEELRPEVEKEVSGGGSKILVGHSYAGLFTLEMLLQHPGSFDTFMAIDPSLWWDRGVFLRQWRQKASGQDFSGKQLYVAFATQQRPGVKLNQFSLADSLKIKIVPDMENRHLRVVYKKFPEEMHGTVALPGIFDGLKSLFRH